MVIRSPARTDGMPAEPPYAAVHAADVGSVMQLLRLEHTDSGHFPVNILLRKCFPIIFSPARSEGSVAGPL